jgi:hypothetical protein
MTTKAEPSFINLEHVTHTAAEYDLLAVGNKREAELYGQSAPTMSWTRKKRTTMQVQAEHCTGHLGLSSSLPCAASASTPHGQNRAEAKAGRRHISRQLPNRLGRTHARFTDFISHFRMDWRSVCRGVDNSCWAVCGDIDGSCWTVCAGIGGSRGGVLCAINCFGAPLVGARSFLGFRPLLFGMEREPAAPAGSTFFTFQDIAEYAGPLGGSRLRHHGTELRSADPAEGTFVAIGQSTPDCAAILITIHGNVSRKTFHPRL